jgi:hypothetical protein
MLIIIAWNSSELGHNHVYVWSGIKKTENVLPVLVKKKRTTPWLGKPVDVV